MGMLEDGRGATTNSPNFSPHRNSSSQYKAVTPHESSESYRYAAGILGCLTLLVVEVRWDRDYGRRNRFPQGSLRHAFELNKDHGRDFFRGQLLLRSQPRHLDLWAAVAAVDHSKRERLRVITNNLANVCRCRTRGACWRLLAAAVWTGAMLALKVCTHGERADI